MLAIGKLKQLYRLLSEYEADSRKFAFPETAAHTETLKDIVGQEIVDAEDN